MAVTLRLRTDAGTLYLPRAGSRLTSTAQFQNGDYIRHEDVLMVVTSITHHLSDIGGAISPVTYIDVASRREHARSAPQVLTDEQILRLKMQGWQEEAK